METEPSLQNYQEPIDTDELLADTTTVQTNPQVIIPIQRPVTSTATVRDQVLRGLNTPANSPKPAFAVLRTTTLQVALGHPLNYVRALMQMGYEPLPAYRGTNLFGRETLYYPNVARYLKHIYNVDGFFGLFRGYGCAVLAKAVAVYTTAKVDELLTPVDSREANDKTKPTWNTCVQKILREVRCQSWGVLASQPFQVMAIRCMGQFIGRENAYSSINIFQNFQEIYNQQGIGGFFVGLIPRWLLEVSVTVLTNVLIHFLKTQFPAQNEVASLYEFIATFIAQTVTYPLSVVTTVTAINNSGLQAGRLPLTPLYANWQDAYRYLRKTEQLKRGSSLFNRAVLGTNGLPAPGTPIPNA